MSQNRKKRNNKRKKWYFRWNNWQIKIIWRANKIVKKREDLKGYWPYNDYDDKELKSKYFKIQLADMSNEIDEKLFEQIFGHTLIKLANKVINTKNKEENQIIVKDIEKNKDKLFEMKDYSNEWLIQPNSWPINLIDAINLILKFNKEFNYENENENEDNEKEKENEKLRKENEKEKLRKEYEKEKLTKEYENEKNEKNKIIKDLNDNLDGIIDKSKSFEDQIKSIRKVKNLNEYYDMHDYDNKELKLKIFKLKIAHLSNITNEKLFEQIFGHTRIKLVNKVINTKNKEECKIIFKKINKNIDKINEMDDDQWVDLYKAANLISDFHGKY